MNSQFLQLYGIGYVAKDTDSEREEICCHDYMGFLFK